MASEEHEASANEAALALEEKKRHWEEQQAVLVAEYEEARRQERADEEEQLRLMRERIEKRKKEREEEDKRLAEQRKNDEERWKAVEEERRRRKEDEEKRKRDEKIKLLKDAEEKAKNVGKRNFQITKKEGDDARSGTGIGNIIQGAEDAGKSQSEMEEEKRAVLAHRIKPLADISNMSDEELYRLVRDTHAHWFALESEKYDMEQTYRRQQYDLMELAERARQMNLSGDRRRRGGVERQDDFDRENDRFQQAPAKVMLCSKYERYSHFTRSTFMERLRKFEDNSHGS